MKITADDLLDGGWELLMQLALAAVVFGLGWWAWPEGFLSTPIPVLDLASVLLAVVSVALFCLGCVMLYFVLVEPIKAFVKGLRSTSGG